MTQIETNLERTEVLYSNILKELRYLRDDISEAKGGIKFGKWLAGFAVAAAGIGVTFYGIFK